MKATRPRLLLLSLVALVAAIAPVFALPAAAQTTQDNGGGIDVVPPLVWGVVGVLIFAAVLGLLYLFKRRVGGFPLHPSWVAPIAIRPSKDFPGDDDTHEATSPEDDVHAAAHPGEHAQAH